MDFRKSGRRRGDFLPDGGAAPHSAGMRLFLLRFSIAGALIFIGALLLSFASPLTVERAAREVARIEIERRVGARIDALSDGRLAQLAQRAAGRNAEQIEATKKVLRDEVPRKVADLIADMLKADCPCRQRMIERAEHAEREHLASLVELREKLAVFIEASYAKVSAQLLREFRVFTATNAAALALLALVTSIRRGAALQLLLPALVIGGAMLITGSIYLFEQNWLHTILFSDYVGIGYAAYMAAVASLLADVVWNEARVTTAIIDTAAHSIGTASPC